MDTHRFSFLVETYATERQKILGVWAMFRDEEVRWRPHPQGRSVHQQMVHQCVSEDYWMKKFLAIEPATGRSSRLLTTIHHAPPGPVNGIFNALAGSTLLSTVIAKNGANISSHVMLPW